jgi:hypothetical protein
MQLCQSGLALERRSKALFLLARIKIQSGEFPGAKEDAFESQRVAKIAGNLYIEASALHVEAIGWQHIGS